MEPSVAIMAGDRLTQNNRLGQTLNVGTDIKSGDKHKMWGQP